jgi:hypothetical protein
VFTGTAAADTIDGGLGADTLSSGGGADVVRVGDDGVGAEGDGDSDTVVFTAADKGFTDQVFEFENITFAGDAADDVLDFTALALTPGSINYTAFALTEGAAMGSDILSFVTPAAASGDNVFYVDVNQDGVFNTANDLVVNLKDSGDIFWATQVLI